MTDIEKNITPALLDWKVDDKGHIVPVSRQFGDVYYSLVDGLAESRYVFLQQNELPHRLAQLADYQTFTIAELGFGTGLNFLVTWDLWNKIKQDNPLTSKGKSTFKENRQHLHFISFEKYPLNKSDLIQALSPWKTTEPELAALIDEFLASYPPLVAGCHRLNFFDYGLTLDLWFGDASDNLAKLAKLANSTSNHNDNNINTNKNNNIDAWFLDGFAPACNESLWAEQIFYQMHRLSGKGTTVATFSCAGVVKRGLKNIDFNIAKVKGFGRKREMLTATMATPPKDRDGDLPEKNESITNGEIKNLKNRGVEDSIAVIGAGVSGLMSAWSLANRGFQVTLIDRTAPLAGASGNPRALLAPKMTPLHHVDEHLHSIGYLYSGRLFRQMDANQQHNLPQPQQPTQQPTQQPITPIIENSTALDLLIKANVNTEQIHAYPDDFAQVLDDMQAKKMTGLSEQNLSENQYLPQAGLVNPQALADYILTHPRIQFAQHTIRQIEETPLAIQLTTDTGQRLTYHRAVICTAYESCHLDSRIFDFRKIRGQLSWFTPTSQQLEKLPKIPLKYGGYCARFSAKMGDDKLNPVSVGDTQFLLGASFVRNDLDTEVRDAEHHHNRNKLVTAVPELANIIPETLTLANTTTESKNTPKEAGRTAQKTMATNIEGWQARVGIRAQTPDYHPLVGHLGDSQRLWTLSGMGSKGYAFAPLCAEVLADKMMGDIPAMPQALLDKLSPNRQRLQTPL